MLAALPAPRDARGMWHSLSRNQRITLGMIAITAVVVLVGFITMSRPSEYQVAFANLKDEDAAAIVTKLKEAKIPYELAERGTIKVPPAQVQEVKLMVAASGVVKGGGGDRLRDLRAAALRPDRVRREDQLPARPRR